MRPSGWRGSGGKDSLVTAAHFVVAIVSFVALTLVASSPTKAAAADITGSYTGIADIIDGIPVAITVTFEQNGSSVTGTLNVRSFACVSGLSFADCQQP
jgi:hypothetical protein